MPWCRLVLTLSAAALLGGCGVQPRDGTQPAKAAAQMPNVKIDLIQDSPGQAAYSAIGFTRIDYARLGQQLRNELLDRMTPNGPSGQAGYTLHVDLKESEAATAIDPAGTVQRSSLTITATYRLFSIADGKQVLFGTASSINDYGILENAFSTTVGRRDAESRVLRSIADDIKTRVALYFERGPEAEDEKAKQKPSEGPKSLKDLIF